MFERCDSCVHRYIYTYAFVENVHHMVNECLLMAEFPKKNLDYMTLQHFSRKSLVLSSIINKFDQNASVVLCYFLLVSYFAGRFCCMTWRWVRHLIFVGSSMARFKSDNSVSFNLCILVFMLLDAMLMIRLLWEFLKK